MHRPGISRFLEQVASWDGEVRPLTLADAVARLVGTVTTTVSTSRRPARRASPASRRRPSRRSPLARSPTFMNDQGLGQGYIRGGEMFTKASGVLEGRVPVKEWQRVVNGVDAGNVGNGWDWRHAFGQVNGDMWATNRGGELYPLKVRFTVTLHPKR